MDPFVCLNSDAVQHIFEFLEPKDCIRCERVSKAWRYFCRCWIKGPGLSLYYPLEKTRYRAVDLYKGMPPIAMFKRRARFESALSKGQASYFEKYSSQSTAAPASETSSSPSQFAANGPFVVWTCGGRKPLGLSWKTLPEAYNRGPTSHDLIASSESQIKQIDLAGITQLNVAADVDSDSFVLETLKVNREGVLYARIHYYVRWQEVPHLTQREIFYFLPTGAVYVDVDPRCREGEDLDDWACIGLGRRLVYYINLENKLFSAFDFTSGAQCYMKNLDHAICGRKSLLSVEIPEADGPELVILPHAGPSIHALDKRFQVSVMDGETGNILQDLFLPGRHYESHSFSYGTKTCTFCTEICISMPRYTGKPPVMWVSIWHVFRFDLKRQTFIRTSTRALLPPPSSPACRLRPYLKDHALSFGTRDDPAWHVHELETVSDGAYSREMRDLFAQACPELIVDGIWLPVNSHELTLSPPREGAGKRTVLDTEERSSQPQDREQNTWRRPEVKRVNTRYFWFSKDSYNAVIGF